MENGPTFDIFSGIPGTPVVLWVKAVRGLAEARAQMEEIAIAKPGPYFVFFSADHSVLASIDSSVPKYKTHSAA